MGIHALVGLWLVYALGLTVGLETGWTWLGALLLAASPLYVFSSLQTMSDLPAMVGVTAAILCAWKRRQRPWLALAAGMAFSVGVLVRPTDLLAILPVAIALGPSLRRWLMLIAGGMPGGRFFRAFPTWRLMVTLR
jgi:4-amino-4-deoxy-L-arabinose transferase-like glycosyltransferase